MRHVISNVRRLDGTTGGGLPFSDYVAASVQYSWSLPTATVFSFFWDHILLEFVRAGKLRMVKYIQEQVLIWNEDAQLWTAAWWSGVCSHACPDFGTSTLFQAVESQNGNLKDALPTGYQHWSLQSIQPLVECSILANGIKKRLVG